MWIKMSLQQNEIHENYVFSGFYRIPRSLFLLQRNIHNTQRRMPPSYAIWILHGKFTEFFIYISIQFLPLFSACCVYSISVAWIHSKSNEYSCWSYASLNVVFMKRVYESVSLWKTSNTVNTSTSQFKGGALWVILAFKEMKKIKQWKFIWSCRSFMASYFFGNSFCSWHISSVSRIFHNALWCKTITKFVNSYFTQKFSCS